MEKQTFDKWTRTATLLNNFRVIPRLMMGFYFYMLYEISWWFMKLEDPTTEQGVLVSVAWAAVPAVGAIYFKSGNIDRDNQEPEYAEPITEMDE